MLYSFIMLNMKISSLLGRFLAPFAVIYGAWQTDVPKLLTVSLTASNSGEASMSMVAITVFIFVSFYILSDMIKSLVGIFVYFGERVTEHMKLLNMVEAYKNNLNVVQERNKIEREKVDQLQRWTENK